MENQLTKLVLALEPINGWVSADESHTGCIAWNKVGSGYTIYGTPGWENEDGETPMDISNDYSGDYTHICTLESNGGSVEENLAAYLSKLKEIISHIETELETI